MKKLLLLASAALLGFGPSLSARTLVTNGHVDELMTDGTIITLQCMDWNGGLDYYFNGGAAKTQLLQSSNFYVIKGNASSGFKLQRLNNPDEYVGKGNNLATNVAEGSAVTFTASIPTSNYGTWNTKPDNLATAKNTVRIVEKNTSNFLNTNERPATPKYASGNGGYSYWKVYTYSQSEVDAIKAIEDGTYALPQHVVEIPAGMTKLVLGEPTTTFEPGKWYMFKNVCRNKYIKQNANPTSGDNAASGYNVVERPESHSNLIADNIPFLFTPEVVPDNEREYTGNAICYLKSAYGTYFITNDSKGYFSLFPRELEITQNGDKQEVKINDKVSNDWYGSNGQKNNRGFANASPDFKLVGYTTGDGATPFVMYPVEFTSEIINVTVNLFHNGRLIESIKIANIAGNEVHVPIPDFFNDEITITVPERSGEINVNLEQLNLPFKHTETTDNMIWQAVQIHTNQPTRNFTWTFTEADSNTIINDQPSDLATNGFADTQLWAFVGNMAEGFKVYNKAAGLGMWLYEDGNTNDSYIKVGTTTDGSVWKPYVSSTNPDNSTYCCFRTSPEANYLNVNAGHINGTTLTHWGNPDQGSTCWFTAAAEPMLPTANSLTFLGEGETYTGPKNAVGAILVNGDLDLSYGPAVIAAAAADKYDLEKAEALRNLIATYNSNVTVNKLEPNGFYRIQNINFGGEYLYTHETDGNIYSTAMNEADYRTNYHSIFKFEPVPGQSDRYYLLSQGKYIGETYDGHAPVQVEADGTRGEYDLVQMNHDDDPNIPTCAAFAIRDNLHNDPTVAAQQTVRNHFHQGGDAGSGDYQITAWGRGAHGSHFYIEKAENIEMDLDMEFKGMHIGFGYFPFPVSASDDQTHFYAIHESFDKETNAPVITYSEIDDFVPANTGFMVSHNKSAKAILNIGEPAATTRNSVRRRILSATDNNTFSDGTTETDTWSGENWTKVGATGAPAQIVAVHEAHPTEVNLNNLRYMDRPITVTTPGIMSVDLVYRTGGGNDRLVIAGVAVLDANGKIAYGDFHRGFSGGNKVDKVYTFNIEKSGSYTLRYYSTNADNALDTHGDITLTFTA
ncbi:MAG: hypothetical protein K2L05_07655, partial [Muribaculaceae bacterium]|nr:hypothetical protein [Muribaculaceae bacterium]